MARAVSEHDYKREIYEMVSIEGLREYILAVFKEAATLYGDQKPNTPENIVQSVKRYIQKNYSADISLELLSRKMFISPSYLSYLFKSVTGESYSDYLKNIRLTRARELLEQNNSLKVFEVCYMVGYKEYKYFSQQFKKAFEPIRQSSGRQREGTTDEIETNSSLVAGTHAARRLRRAADATEDGTAQSGSAYVIGISPLTTQHEYYVGYIEGIQKAAREVGVEAIVVDSKWDAEKQESDIRTFIDEEVDAIICSPVDPETIGAVLREAEAAGIAVVVEMTYVKGITPLVGTDQYAGGRLAGQYAGKWINAHCGGQCEVAILDFPYFKNINDRVSGFKDGLMRNAPAQRSWQWWMPRPRWKQL